ncbi:MAG: HipA domain-containing protein [Hyphomicrobiaceae bacterium]|nr:HipA domain-containing protein [Hyphomicrobiaceae bacterium]
MAGLLWGRVYYKEHFAGILREEPGERMSFAYDQSYLATSQPAIAHTLSLREEPFLSQSGLHPFFDNLVAEGWLADAQSRFLGRRAATRFELLLAFGFDCAGAVSIVDPEPAEFSKTLTDMDDPKELAVLTSRASLSGVQPKLALVERNGKFYPAKINELSSHIAKFPSEGHSDLVANEYLTMQAFKALHPKDDIAQLHIDGIEGTEEEALIIKRFDRSSDGQRIHFEEFNQLLGRPSKAKYDGAHKDMADFLRETEGCIPTEIYRLYLRILTGILVGNTDMHLKNFAMFHTDSGLRLTPSYDQVAAALYNYKTMPLAIGGAHDLPIGSIKPGSLIKMGEEFKLSKAAIKMAVDELAVNIDAAKETVHASNAGSQALKDQLITFMEKRWNGTLKPLGALIGKRSSTKR